MPDYGNFAPIASPGSYQDRLRFWAIVRQRPNLQQVIIARFRNRSDADGHLRFLRQHLPDGRFEVVFDTRKE